MVSEPEPEGEVGQAEPDVVVIVCPSIIIVILVVIAVFVLSCITQKYWWKTKLNLHRATVWPFIGPAGLTGESRFLTIYDQQLLHRMEAFQNRPHILLKIVTITLVSIAVCPILLLLYTTITNNYWPPEDFSEVPEINDPIESFLTPAGLIYAIAFGFAFQEATKVQTNVRTNVLSLVNYTNNIAYNCITSPHVFTEEDRKKILTTLKDEVIIWVNQILAYSQNVVPYKSNLSDVIDIIQANENRFEKPLDRAFSQKMLSDVHKLKQLTTAALNQMCGKMDLLQWGFLEAIANFAFFGVLLIKADSNAYQVTICVITVFTISLFSYILADKDNPYNGVYRTDLSIIKTMLQDMELKCLGHDEVTHKMFD